MYRYKTILIDDEPLAIDVLGHYLKLFPRYELCGSFTDPTNALEYLQKNNVDLAFCDIEMPKLSGLNLAKIARDKTRFIMTTAYSEYALQSFEIQVVDYLLKPISLERFSMGITHFEKQISTQNPLEKTAISTHFFIKDGHQYAKINIADIDYVTSLKDYLKIVCGEKYYLTLKTLKSMQAFLGEADFIRVHKSFLVARAKIRAYNGHELKINAHKIPVSSSYKTTVKNYLEKNRV